jgi:hypothetical protein
MSGLEDAVNEAYERAQTSTDPSDWRLYHALVGALMAERRQPPEPADTTGIPGASEAGFAANISIPPGERDN